MAQQAVRSQGMTIADPHAIPESDATCHEYLVEADQAWDAGNTDLADELYHALSQSHFASSAQNSHATYRVGLIALNNGDADRALTSFEASHEPGAADAVKSLQNATHDDPTPSGDVVPETREQFEAWFAAGIAAKHSADLNLAYGLFVAAAGTTATTPGNIAMAEANAGIIAHDMGDDGLAGQWLEHALPNLADDDPLLAKVRALLKRFGGAHVEADDDSPGSGALLHRRDGLPGAQVRRCA